MRNNKWVADYDNNIVRDYDRYIKEETKNGNLTKDDIQYISFFQGSYENACKFFGIDPSSALIYNKEKKEKEVTNDIDIKLKRLEKLIEKNQTNKRYVKKSTPEIKSILISKMNEQYFYVQAEMREDIANQAIINCYSFIYSVDRFFLDNNFDDRLLNKRKIKVQRFYELNPTFYDSVL